MHLFFRLLFGFVVFILAISSAQAATITSTIAGGVWTNFSTWEGGVLPTTGDDVIIQGDVYVVNNLVLSGDLEITSSGALQNSLAPQYYIDYEILVEGDIENNGIIGNSENTFGNRLKVITKGDLVNNNEILVTEFDVYGDIENNNTITSGLGVVQGDVIHADGAEWIGGLQLQTSTTDSIHLLDVNETFSPNLTLLSDTTIEGNFIFQNNIYLGGHTLFLDTTNSIYAGRLKGPGKVYSSNGNGDTELLESSTAEGIETNFENLETMVLNGIVGRNVSVGERIQGLATVDNLKINGNVIVDGDTSVSGSLFVEENKRLQNLLAPQYYIDYEILVEGDIENNGIIGNSENTFGNRLKVITKGDLVNNNEILVTEFDVYGHIENNNTITSNQFHLKWPQQGDTINHEIAITDFPVESISGTSKLLPNGFLNTAQDVYWSVKGINADGIKTDPSETRCINVEGCTGGIPAPLNLTQSYILPVVGTEEEINPGESLGKFQSGSGIIVQAFIPILDRSSLNFIVNLNYLDEGFERSFTGSITEEGDGRLKLVNIPVGNYSWSAKVVANNGIESEVTEFSNIETDFSIYEGFEPYPHGYNFDNDGTSIFLLDGGISRNYFTGISRINEGSKWEIFRKTYDLSFATNGNGEISENILIDAFESQPLNRINPFGRGSCYGMAASALMKYKHPNFIINNYPIFDNNLGSNYINSLPRISESIIDNWDQLDSGNTLSTILSFQLSQYSENFHQSALIRGPQKVLSELKNDTENKYVIGFTGSNAHAVIPYKVEGNRIYVWDNNFPNDYTQYIEIVGNSYSKNNYSRTEFNDIFLIDIDVIYNGGKKSTPFGFNEYDQLISLSGSLDVVLTDSEGNRSGFENGNILNGIDGIEPIVPLSDLGNGTYLENTFKQIYIPQKQDDIIIEIFGKIDESYDLMIAGGDYYTKLEGVQTSSGQIDTFISTATNLKIDFDDTKTGYYNLLFDNFQDNGTGTVYVDSVNVKNEPQQYSIDWNKVTENSPESVLYSLDTDSDGIYDDVSTFSPIFQDKEIPTTSASFSGTLIQGTTDTYSELVSISLSSIDNIGGSGVQEIYYTLDNGTGAVFSPFEEEILVQGIGDYTISYYSVDYFGNTEEIKTQNFSLSELPELYSGTISGYVYEDVNENGTHDTGEKYKAGWKICIDENNNDSCEENVEPFIVTNNDGYYEFDGLSSGTYTVLKVSKTNWGLTMNQNHYYTLSVTNGGAYTNNDFGVIKLKGGKK